MMMFGGTPLALIALVKPSITILRRFVTQILLTNIISINEITLLLFCSILRKEKFRLLNLRAVFWNRLINSFTVSRGVVRVQREGGGIDRVLARRTAMQRHAALFCAMKANSKQNYVGPASQY